MNHLKTATQKLHKQAEETPFNKEMIQGKLSKEAYGAYLLQHQSIFQTLEKFDLPHPDLSRGNALKEDIEELAQHIQDVLILDATRNYCAHLSALNPTNIQAHIYLNYMALLFGGQLSKQKVPSTGKIYDFENQAALVQSIRKIQHDSWVDEVNKGFNYHIQILKELELYL